MGVARASAAYSAVMERAPIPGDGPREQVEVGEPGPAQGEARREEREEDYSWFFVVGLIAVLVTFTHLAARNGLMDFGVYHAAAVRLRDGLGIYDHAPGTLPFTYPPAAAYLMYPLAFLSEVNAGHVFTFLSLLALGRTSFLLVHAALPTMGQRARVLSAAAVPAALLTAEPSEFTIAFGQINFILLWLVCEDALGRPRLPRGVLTGIAAAIKLTPIVFLVAWGIAGRWRTAAWGMGTFATAAALGFVADPSAAARYWSDLLSNVERVGVIQYAHNQSINGTLWRVLGEGGSVPLWFALSAATGLVAVVAARSLARRGDDLGFVAVMGVAMTMVSPIAWGHHWVWAYPAVLWLAGSLWSQRPHPALLLTAVPVFWGRLVHLMPQGDNQELTGPLFVRVLQSPYVYWGLAFLLTVLVAEVRPHRRRARA